LGAAEVKFLKPVKNGMKAIAEAKTVESVGKKRMVEVHVDVEDKPVFKGIFTCFVLDKHVLDA
jgi:acyl-coenzyme A thioesterase PaaI-like protein